MTELEISGDRLQRERLYLVALALGTYLLMCGFVFWRILVLTEHHFVFSLDDPYIHFALARSIAYGSYGINPGEPSSPSSSILWPFLLAIFARAASLPRVAFALNLLCGMGASVVCAMCVSMWPHRDRQRLEFTRKVLAVLALVLTTNLVGLTFLGMEHTLQVMLAAICALGMIRCLQGRPIPLACQLAAVVIPTVRYECLGITLAVALALYGQNRKRRALLLLGASLLPLITYSAFLHHLGLPVLPLSVLLKAQVGTVDGTSLQGVIAQISRNFHKLLVERERQFFLVLLALLTGFAVYEKDRARRFAFAGAAAVVGLHALIGRFNWFHRYELYVVMFCLVILLYAVHEMWRMPFVFYALCLLCCVSLYREGLMQTPRAAQDIYLEQGQTHRFLSDYFHGNVAVNDLGMAALYRRQDQYVLDLAGLGSLEVARADKSSPKWMSTVAHEHRVGVVAIFPAWFRSGIPVNWTELGRVCLDRSPMLIIRCVHFYATEDASVPGLQRSFEEFARTLPKGDSAVIGPTSPRDPLP